jgi:hypothetical protein
MEIWFKGLGKPRCLAVHVLDVMASVKIVFIYMNKFKCWHSFLTLNIIFYINVAFISFIKD